MRYAFVPLAFGLGANAYVVRSNTQCFKLSASGGASGVLGQLGDGQNRVGGGHPTGCYCLDGNGGFTDSNGRGCILTPPTTQFQCDVGATPTNGFAVSPSGSVTYNGSGKFYACPVNDNGEYNVYTTPAPGQKKCVEITLGSAGSCGADASQPAGTPPASTTVVTKTKPAKNPVGTPGASQPPHPSGPPAVGPHGPGNTGYPGKPDHPGPHGKPSGNPEGPGHPGKPEGSQPAGKPSVPAPETPVAPKPSQPAVQPPKSTPVAPAPSSPKIQPPVVPKPSSPAPPVPGVSQQSECVPQVFTVTVTKPVAPPAVTPTPPASSKPAPPASSKPVVTTPAPSKPVPTPSPSPPAPSKPAGNGTCPQDLNGNYEYPHLIVPVDSEHPDKAYGTSYNGKISAHVCTIFNFDIPASYAGKKCSTMFMLPLKKDLETSDYTISGHGKCTISKLKGNANAQTSWSNKPVKMSDVASMEMTPGNTYPVDSGACAAGTTVSYEICGSSDFSINFFQDWNPSPIGLYIRQC
ncbi:glucan endo-1,3-beta-D-glucosidase [Alternaria panax]|uniref:Glucan endo-1,3-beta-D-glucosidase n=1 Tax=Alternaria panax TaxID=48097 RepID=A0AAD4FCQ9_9PLEO|nr:glucan endo-1,3-beta-D-glucosidase [Alternaria panax]